MNVVNPNKLSQIQQKLQAELTKVQTRLSELNSQDPFQDPDRLNDNAANDREASEEEGHDRIAAQKETLEAQKLEVENALKRITDGTYGTCLNCGNIIEEKRLEIFPTAVTCVDCQSKVQ